MLSSVSHEDPDRELPPLALELPPEAATMSGEEVYYLGEQLLIRGQSLQAAAFLARAAELLPGDSFSHGNLAIALHQMSSATSGRRLDIKYFLFYSDGNFHTRA